MFKSMKNFAADESGVTAVQTVGTVFTEIGGSLK